MMRPSRSRSANTVRGIIYRHGCRSQSKPGEQASQRKCEERGQMEEMRIDHIGERSTEPITDEGGGGKAHHLTEKLTRSQDVLLKSSLFTQPGHVQTSV